MTKEEWNEAVRNYIREHGEKHNDDYWIDNSVLFEFVKTLPPVTPKPRTGHWIKVEENTYRCNLCGRTVHKDTMEDMQIDYLYCHCGAKMEGERANDKRRSDCDYGK